MRRIVKCSLLLALVIGLNACSPTSQPQVPSPTASLIPSMTPAATATQSVAATGTATATAAVTVVSAGAAGSATANGITAKLLNFSDDGQTANVDFCVSVSLHTYTLSPIPTLLIDQVPAPFLSGGSDFPSGPGCISASYQVSADQIAQAQHVTLLIDGSLRMSPPPGDPDAACQAARTTLMAQYPGLDFQCHFSMAGYVTQIQPPDGMTQEQAQILITDTIEGAIYGPWTLTIK